MEIVHSDINSVSKRPYILFSMVFTCPHTTASQLVWTQDFFKEIVSNIYEHNSSFNVEYVLLMIFLWHSIQS